MRSLVGPANRPEMVVGEFAVDGCFDISGLHQVSDIRDQVVWRIMPVNLSRW